MEHTLTLEDICQLLKISVQTGRNRLSRGAPMPPSFRTGRRRLFLASAVDAWIREKASVDEQAGALSEAPRRGRPRMETSGLI